VSLICTAAVGSAWPDSAINAMTGTSITRPSGEPS
jgi:hypothetical protein